MDGKVLEAKDVAKIATLPTLDEARAKIAVFSTPPPYFNNFWPQKLLFANEKVKVKLNSLSNG